MLIRYFKELKMLNAYFVSMVLIILSISPRKTYLVFITHYVKMQNPTNEPNKGDFKFSSHLNQEKTVYLI